MSILGAFIALPLGSAAQMSAAESPAACAPEGNVTFICGQNAPEDLIHIAGTNWVIASSYVGSGIGFIDVRDRKTTIVYPSAKVAKQFDSQTYADCPGPPESDANDKLAFNTHGLALHQEMNGRYTLYVVHHGKRESIEVFDLDLLGQTPSATWIGCAVAPYPVGLNSVVGIPDGGFIATNFLERGPGEAAAWVKINAGENNGELWEWHPRTGWKKVPGSEASGPNGVELSKDGKWIYVAAWGARSFFRLSRGQAQPIRDTVPLGFNVDNIRWGSDGMIYAGGQGVDSTQVVKIDPQTFKVTKLINRPNTSSFGGGTIGIPVGKEIWVGSYKGDRIAVFPATE